LLLLATGLIVLGPKRLPEIANKIGGWVGQARRMTRAMRRQLEEELNLDEFSNIARPKTAPRMGPAIQDRPIPKTPAPNPADPAYDDSTADVKPVADHVPRDDDAYSPLHEKDKE